MSVSASLENAQRNLTTALRRTAARARALTLVGVLGRVAAVLFALQLAYVVVANLIVRSSLIKDAVSDAEGFQLEYGSAYSLWPGHARVRDLSLRVEDYNVQFEVAIASADLSIALSELPFKKFHVTRLDAEGTRFRMRHKLITIGDDAERVAAYPPIAGFADPPYFTGVRSPPIADADYDLWSLRVENVRARVTELWVMEHRLRGEGVARGSFVVKPARWVQVTPAELVLERGTWTLGEHRLAEQVRGKITCDIPDMRVQESEGAQVLGDISASVRLELSGGKLDFLRAYLARLAPIGYSGRAEWLVDMNLQRGVVERGSRVSLRATPLRLSYDDAELSGDWMLNFGRDLPSAPDELVLALSSPRLDAKRRESAQPAPALLGLAASVRLVGVDLKQPVELGEARFGVAEAHAPSLSWFDTAGVKLSGKARASLEVLRERGGAVLGDASLDARSANFRNRQLRLGADVSAKLSVSRAPGSEALDFKQLSLSLTHASVENAGKRSDPFGLTLDGAGLRLAPPKVSGVVRVRLSSTEAVLPLLMSEPIKDIAGTALALEHLEARASVAYEGGDFDVRVIEAESGNVRMRGYLRKRAAQPLGAFLLSSGPINVGVTLSEGDTEISPFVSDEWLVTAWPRLLRHEPKAG